MVVICPRAVTLLGSVLLAAVVLACGGDEPTATATGETIALGEEVYQANCATCHGVNGEGQPNWQSRRPDGTLPAPPHDSTGHTWHHSDAELIEIIERGGQAVYGGDGFQSGMPAWDGRLSDEELLAILAYIKTMWGPEERQYQASLEQ